MTIDPRIPLMVQPVKSELDRQQSLADLAMRQQSTELQRRAMQREEDTRTTLASYLLKPNEAGFSALALAAPEMAMQARGYIEQRQFGRALADYMGAGAQGADQPPVEQRPALVQPLGQSAPQTVESVFAGAFAGDPAAGAPEQSQQADGIDLSFLGEPQTGRDRAFARMMQIDPLRAMSIQSDFREQMVERLQGERDFLSLAAETLGTVNDEAGWQRALGRLLPMAQALGADLSQIPANYPGPAAVQEMLAETLPAKEQLTLFMQQANIDDDNARQDRNTDSLITNREASLAERRRTNRAREGIAADRESRIAARQRTGGNRSTSRRSSRTGGGSSNIPTLASPEAARGLAPGTQFRTPDGRVLRVPLQ